MEIRKQMTDRLRGVGAHVPFEKAVEDIPFEKLGERPDGCPYSIWELVDHIRRAQHDILEYTLDPSYESPPWPEGYWPDESSPSSEGVWKETLASIREDREKLIEVLDDPTRMITTEHSVLREVSIAAAHLSYHTGQIVLLRRLLGIWKG